MQQQNIEKEKSKTNKENIMKNIYIDKVVVNIGVGEAAEELDRAIKILELVTKKKCVKTRCKVKLPTWGIRPGLPIGTKTTLRGKDAFNFIQLTLKAKKDKLNKKSFSKDGNFSYGVEEYLDVPGIKYDPDLGVRGFDVCVNLRRNGYRVKLRKHNKNKIGKKHLISKEEAINFIKEKFKIVIE